MRRKEHDKTFKIIEKKFNAKKSWASERMNEGKENIVVSSAGAGQPSIPSIVTGTQETCDTCVDRISVVRPFFHSSIWIEYNNNYYQSKRARGMTEGKTKKIGQEERERKKNTHTFAWKRIIVV